MSIVEFFKNNFEYFWDRYCLSNKVGYKKLGPEESGASVNFFIFWAQNSENTVRVMIIFYLPSNKLTPIILANITKEVVISNNIIKKMPVRLKNIQKRVGNFYFSDHEMSSLLKDDGSLDEFARKKIHSFVDSDFQRIVSSLVCKGGRNNKIRGHSVYAIPSGLYGLGKNRKH